MRVLDQVLSVFLSSSSYLLLKMFVFTPNEPLVKIILILFVCFGVIVAWGLGFTLIIIISKIILNKFDSIAKHRLDE